MAPLRMFLVLGLFLFKGKPAKAIVNGIKLCLPDGADQKYNAPNTEINFSKIKYTHGTVTYLIPGKVSIDVPGTYRLSVTLVSPAGQWAYIKAYKNTDPLDDEFFTSAYLGTTLEGISYTLTLPLQKNDEVYFKTSPLPASYFPMTLTHSSCFELVSV